MKVLVAFEESGTVRDEFTKLGHYALSCDLQPSRTEGLHYQGDIDHVLNKQWDIIIAFPPCTHLSTSGAKHFEGKRLDGRQRSAIELFVKILNADCEKIAIENPVGIISGKYIKKYFPDLCEKYGLPKKPTQIIQPWQFGDSYQKTTCLWLKNLPKLEPTNIVGRGEFYVSPTGKRIPKWYSDNKSSKVRSKTFPGIAEAMALQWGGDETWKFL